MRLGNDFLDAYMEYVEETEPPRIFHLWSALSGIGACLGRRCFFPFGHTRIFPNEYIFLVGPPGVRKSTVLGITQKLLKSYTNIRFSPDDTGGARQGLIAAMQGTVPAEEDGVIKAIQNGEAINGEVLDGLANLQLNIDDSRVMYISASELTTFLGINSPDMITFLTKMWDGEDYDYRLKNELRTLHNPLLSLIGGTTPSAIAKALPPDSIGGGFMSRLLLVYGNKKYKRQARPTGLDKQCGEFIGLCFKYAETQLNGPFSETRSAAAALDDLYEYQVKINDPRFIYYIERRHTHLIKIVMALAAAERRAEIQQKDVEAAQLILSTTEANMVDALGEFGLTQLGAAKQKMLEFIQHMSPNPVSQAVLSAVMKRDIASPADLTNSIIDLENAGKIQRVRVDTGDAFVYMDKGAEMRAQIDRLLTSEIGEEQLEIFPK